MRFWRRRLNTAKGMNEMYRDLIEIGGDTDTNCSIAGQVAGTLLGAEYMPSALLHKLESLREYAWISQVLSRFKVRYNGV